MSRVQVICSWFSNDCLSFVLLRLLWFSFLCFRLSFDFRIRLFFDFWIRLSFCFRICLFFDFRVRLFLDFRINILFDFWNLLILLMDFSFDFRILRILLFFRFLNFLSSFFFRSLKMSFFHSALVISYVAISKTSNKKRRVEFLNISENVSFFRDAKMFDDNAKMKNAKKKISLCNMKNLNQFEVNIF